MNEPILPQPGDIIDGRYEVAAEVGAGSFGVVYRCYELETDENVAVKMLKPGALESEEMVARFDREARICSKLVHPNTVKLQASGTHVAPALPISLPYLAFDFVHGLPLGVLCQLRGSLRVEEAVHIVAGLLDSLEEAHQHGIVHRDIKPNNILLEAPEVMRTLPEAAEDLWARVGVPSVRHPLWLELERLQVKVVDFGLGKLLAIGDRRVKRLTRIGDAAGTVHYMSPEQVRGKGDIDHRADVYGAGALLYRLLAGAPPFDGKSAAEVASGHLNMDPPGLPGDLGGHAVEEVFKVAAAKDPADRFPSAAHMAWALRAALDPSTMGQPAPDFELPPRVRRRGLLGRLFGKK